MKRLPLEILDPVCGMTVEPATAAGEFEYAGTKYYFCSKGCLAKFSADPSAFIKKDAIDPICGMSVDPANAAGEFEYDRTKYYFCSKGCLAKFSADPAAYLQPNERPSVTK